MIWFKCWSMNETERRIKKTFAIFILKVCVTTKQNVLISRFIHKSLTTNMSPYGHTEGVTSVQEMKCHLSMYVKNDTSGEIKIPPKTNKRHYRRIRAIRNHIFFERQKTEKVSD